MPVPDREHPFRRARTLAPSATPKRPASAGSSPAAPVIDFRHVSLVHRSGALGLDRATFAVPRGQLAFLAGTAGAGKSTAMRLITRELAPSGGAVFVAGRDLSLIGRDGLSAYRRNLGLVRHDSTLMPDRSVQEQIVDALRVTGASRSDRGGWAGEILRLTGLANRAASLPEQLTPGEHRRVCIARAFAGRPPLLLADEPARGLDNEAGIGIMRLLYRINRTGTTVLVATRDRDLVAKLRRRVIELDRGEVVNDVAAGLHADDESTREFAARVRGATADPELDPAEARAASAVRFARALHRDPGQPG
jgi:cell division transport system ATP-binding protein